MGPEGLDVFTSVNEKACKIERDKNLKFGIVDKKKDKKKIGVNREIKIKVELQRDNLDFQYDVSTNDSHVAFCCC